MASNISRVNDGKIKIILSISDVMKFGIKPNEDLCHVLPVLITDTRYIQSDLSQKTILCQNRFQISVIFWYMFQSLAVEWNKSKNRQTQLPQDSAQYRGHCLTYCVWTGAYICSAII